MRWKARYSAQKHMLPQGVRTDSRCRMGVSGVRRAFRSGFSTHLELADGDVPSWVTWCLGGDLERVDGSLNERGVGVTTNDTQRLSSADILNGKGVRTIEEQDYWRNRHSWPTIGTAVIYCDERGVDHNGLITECWGDPKTSGTDYGPCVNLLHLSSDPNKRDQYGRQIERPSSVSHVGCPGTAHGRYWRYADEERKPYQQPSG